MGVATHDWELWSTHARRVVTDAARLPEAVATATALLDEVELAASRFRDDSELRRLRSRLDQEGGPVPISPLLRHLVAIALDAAEHTGGAVDPTVGRALVELGYDRDIGDLRAPGAVDGLGDGEDGAVVERPVFGWRSVELTAGGISLPPGVELDLGATAKAAAADLVAQRISDQLGTGVLVSLGGDIATAGPAPAGDWQVTVRDGADQPPAHVALPAGAALATSSTLQRRWRHGGRTVHHILDPFTSLPAEPVWRTVSVAAGRCADANAASTAVVVKGATGPRWLRERGLTARLVDHTGRVHLVGGWPAEQDHAA